MYVRTFVYGPGGPDSAKMNFTSSRPFEFVYLSCPPESDLRAMVLVTPLHLQLIHIFVLVSVLSCTALHARYSVSC